MRIEVLVVMVEGWVVYIHTGVNERKRKVP